MHFLAYSCFVLHCFFFFLDGLVVVNVAVIVAVVVLGFFIPALHLDSLTGISCTFFYL